MIQIREENAKHLAQIIYLGTLVANEYAKTQEENTDFADLAEEVYRQVIVSAGEAASAEEVTDRQIEKMHGQLYDEVDGLYEIYKSHVFADKLAHILAERNYPAAEMNREDLEDRMAAAEIYEKMLCDQGTSFISLSAPNVNRQIDRRKGKN